MKTPKKIKETGPNVRTRLICVSTSYISVRYENNNKK